MCSRRRPLFGVASRVILGLPRSKWTRKYRLHFPLRRSPCPALPLPTASALFGPPFRLWSRVTGWGASPSTETQVERNTCPGDGRCTLFMMTFLQKQGSSPTRPPRHLIPTSGPGMTGLQWTDSGTPLLALQFAFTFSRSVSDCYLVKIPRNRDYPSGSPNSPQPERIQNKKADILNA